MVRSSHTIYHSATDERDALYKQYLRTTKEFEKVWKKVSPTVDELFGDCKRANGKHDLFESSLEAFRAVLKKLQANETACKEAAAAKEAHGKHPDSNQAGEAMEKAQKAKEETAQDLEIAIEKVETARETGLRHMEKDFGSSAYKEVREYFEYTCYMLERKSTNNLAQAITYWERASEVQKNICAVYAKGRISSLQAETKKLEVKVLPSLPMDDIHTVESITYRIKEIGEESRSLKQEVNKTVGQHNPVLSKIFLELKFFHGDVKLAEQKRVREKEREEKQAQAKLQR